MLNNEILRRSCNRLSDLDHMTTESSLKKELIILAARQRLAKTAASSMPKYQEPVGQTDAIASLEMGAEEV